MYAAPAAEELAHRLRAGRRKGRVEPREEEEAGAPVEGGRIAVDERDLRRIGRVVVVVEVRPVILDDRGRARGWRDSARDRARHREPGIENAGAADVPVTADRARRKLARGPLQDRQHTARGQRGVPRQHHRYDAAHLGRGRARADRVRVGVGPDHGLPVVRQREHAAVIEIAARRRDVDAAAEVAVERDVAEAIAGRDGDDATAAGRREVARVGRFVARRDHDDGALRQRVVDCFLDGIGAAAQAAQAHVDHFRRERIRRHACDRHARRPQHALEDVLVGTAAFAEHAHGDDLREEVDAGHPDAVVHVAGDDAGHERAVPRARMRGEAAAGAVLDPVAVVRGSLSRPLPSRAKLGS